MVKFLVVDDDIEVVDLVVSTLEKLGKNNKIETVFTGMDAWRKINEFMPDVLILDLKLPGMYGTSICAKIRKSEIGKKMKICVLTSYLTNGVRQRLQEAGADVCLQKPFNPDEFLKNVQELMPS